MGDRGDRCWRLLNACPRCRSLDVLLHERCVGLLGRKRSSGTNCPAGKRAQVAQAQMPPDVAVEGKARSESMERCETLPLA